ncbi:hypothetical protein [Actinomadura bangladeshensis]|uniref:Uncharacterized protein n=1 Tax=Actinomadura bangladeshensis TaxID=453573 RepID=A0A6L9Q803_9ACTN|nr:hypothetical protein [Actinomadura bangladeshensis]NEA21579.1 hypothetical protein [Actinomadura bangladeshensis]NEA22539.1 hypothetical protein [Actinomadura bangladeshensis]
MKPTAASHDVTEECSETHCYVHAVDEPNAGAYLVCFECNHAYPTARALRRDYRRGSWEASAANEHCRADRLWRRLWRVVTVRASRVRFCPHCIHDF